MPVLLLHGWPGFWFDWREVIVPLARAYDVVVPDLRGFGRSGAPPLPAVERYGPSAHAADVIALLDSLGLSRIVIAAHDIGATIAQTVARLAPERVAALMLCNPPYPGIGERRFTPQAQQEFWYQHFHNLALSELLVGRDRDSVRAYLAYFHSHWCGRRDRLRNADFEAIVDVYARPGAFVTSIAYYRARAAGRLAQAQVDPRTEQVDAPTIVLWGERDPVIPVAWADRLEQTFPDHELTVLTDVGHFVPWEAPEETVAAIGRAVSRSTTATGSR
jgi:pimeloyl-ACP methyl ester carboxylesterase